RRVLDTLTLPGLSRRRRWPPGLCQHDHVPEREARVPTGDRAQQLITVPAPPPGLTAGSPPRHRRGPGRWPPEPSLLATARHPVMRARTPAVLHGPVAGPAALALTACGPARPPGNLVRARPGPRSSRPASPRVPGGRPRPA